jgi:predicted RNA-binding protein YlqC (UPF0109 family)
VQARDRLQSDFAEGDAATATEGRCRNRAPRAWRSCRQLGFADLPALWDASSKALLSLSSSSLGAQMPAISLKELIEFLARALVDKPDEVQVVEISGEQTVVLELRVAKDDLGKVIGKQGRTVKAMRAILSAASSKVRKRAELEILE